MKKQNRNLISEWLDVKKTWPIEHTVPLSLIKQEYTFKMRNYRTPITTELIEKLLLQVLKELKEKSINDLN
jgi:hypothetical protein